LFERQFPNFHPNIVRQKAFNRLFTIAHSMGLVSFSRVRSILGRSILQSNAEP
jgi:hypothetical protein